MKFRTCVEYSLVLKVYVRFCLHIKYVSLSEPKYTTLTYNLVSGPNFTVLTMSSIFQIMVNMGLPWECFYALSFTNMSKIKRIQKKVMPSYRLVNIGPGTRSGPISFFLAWHRAQIRLFLMSSTWHVLKFDQTCILNDLFKFAIILLNWETQSTSHQK